MLKPELPLVSIYIIQTPWVDIYVSLEPHPVLPCLESFIDVTLSPDPMLTYRITGGVLDFYIFVGGSQEEVVQQYHALIGRISNLLIGFGW